MIMIKILFWIMGISTAACLLMGMWVLYIIARDNREDTWTHRTGPD